MYTKAIDRMLDIVDALQADFTDCTEGLVTLASVVLLRYLKVAAVDRHKIDLVAQVCLTVASKLNERMYVPLGRSDGTKEERFKCKLELELRPSDAARRDDDGGGAASSSSPSASASSAWSWSADGGSAVAIEPRLAGYKSELRECRMKIMYV